MLPNIKRQNRFFSSIKYIFGLSLFIALLTQSFFSNGQTVNLDSLRAARKHVIDSTIAARRHHIDSLKQARKHYNDSLKLVRQHRSDSLRAIREARINRLKAIRAYRSSKHYKDSVTAVRKHHVDSLLAARKHIADSIKQVREHRRDSIVAVREHTIDSMRHARKVFLDSLHAHLDSVRAARAAALAKLKAERKRRSDSLAAIRKYRQSQPFKDSVAAIRKHHRDSIIAVRKHYRDSVRAVRKAQVDSMMAVRKRYNDSLRAAMDSMRVARRHMIDSLIAVRKARADSLAAIRAAREAKYKKDVEKRKKKKALALEIKIKSKRKHYSNKKMLRKKWSVPRRFFQNTYTHYNYYYNANLKMDMAKANMLRARHDNYDSLLNLFPFNPNTDSAKLASDMDTIISKASVGIQIHDPRSKWQDDLYLLVGEAYYFKGDYKNAGAAFKQVVHIDQIRKEKKNKKHKSKKREKALRGYIVPNKKGVAGWFQRTPAENLAIMWLSRTFVQKNKIKKAQSLLDMVRNEENFPDQLRGRLALEQAFIDLKQKDDENAIQSLVKVNADKNSEDWLRQRAGFIAAQLYQKKEKQDSANYYFNKVLALHPPIDMDFYAHKNIAFNNLHAGGDKNITTEMLTKMASDGKYKPFYGQVYYGLALAAQESNEPKKAMSNFRKSLAFGTNNPKQMGLTYTAMGDAYYKKHDYISAKKAYDSATIFLVNFQKLPQYDRASLRSSSLANITGPAEIVRTTDSLLRLAALPEKEQRKIIRQYIKALEKAREDSIFLAQNAQNMSSHAPMLNNMSNKNKAWYFSNPSRVEKGKMKFQQKWGNRKLADNWQLASSSSMPSAGLAAGDENTNENTNDGIPDESTLYAAIPHSAKDIQAAKERLQNALFRLGKGYYTDLEDFKNALSTFDTLQQKFPQNPYSAEVLYFRYLIAMRQGQTEKANTYREQLFRHFPESKWVKLLQKAQNTASGQGPSATVNQGIVNNNAHQAPSDSVVKQDISEHIDAYYDETYKMLMNREYKKALQRIQRYPSLYSLPGAYVPKFTLLQSIALVGDGQYQKADSLLTTFIAQYPKSDLLASAKDVKAYIAKTYGHPKPFNKGLLNTKNKADLQASSGHFTYQTDTPYFLIIAAPADMRIFALKSGLRDFNMMQDQGQNISVSMTTLNPKNNLIICQQFKNLQTAKSYYHDVLKTKTLFRDYPKKDYHLLLISQSNYTIMIGQRSLSNYLAFYSKHYKNL